MKRPDWLNLPFAEAVNFFLSKENVSVGKWDELTAEQYEYSFGVAGMIKGDLLDHTKKTIASMLAEGVPYDEVQAKLATAMNSAGWVTNKGLPPSERRIYIIADTNVRQSYKRGNIEQFNAAGGVEKYPYFIWRHRDSLDYRLHHKALHNKAISTNSEFARKCFPPHGFGCRCTGQFANERIINRMGAKIIAPPDVKTYLEKGFGGLEIKSLKSELKDIKNSRSN